MGELIYLILSSFCIVKLFKSLNHVQKISIFEIILQIPKLATISNVTGGGGADMWGLAPPI